MYDKLACYKLDGSLRRACKALRSVDTSLDFGGQGGSFLINFKKLSRNGRII